MALLRFGTALTAVGVFLALGSVASAEMPRVGDSAKDFDLRTIGGESVKLSSLTAEGPVVLVVLRGYPGYQCPLCTRQVGDLMSRASAFEEAGAKVVLVYPGPADDLKVKAEEFLGGKKLPSPLTLAIDPDYTFTNLYGLRWNAPGETSYPSTFVIDKSGTIRSAKVSKEHGGRVGAKAILDALAKLK